MTYGVVTILMTLNVSQGHSLIAVIYKGVFLYSYAAVDKLSTELTLHIVWLSAIPEPVWLVCGFSQ